MNRNHRSLIRSWVKQHLCEWDPIGVIKMNPKTDDEYDSYCLQIVSMLESDCDVFQLSDHLFQLETNAMGLSGDKARCNRVATKLVDGYQSRSFKSDN